MTAPRTRLLLVSSLPPPTGGIPTWTVGVLGSGLKDRFEIEVVDTSPAKKLTVEQRSRFRLDRVVDALRILLELLWKLVRFRPQIVHVNTPYHWAFLRDALAVWMASLTGARTVLHFRGGDFPEFAQQASRPIRALIRATLRRTDRLIALTGQTLVFLKGAVDPERVCYVPNFVRLEDFGPPPEQREKRERPLEALFVGWIVEGKGVRELLEAARAFPEVRFTLVGPVQPSFLDAVRGELEAARAHVQLLPACPREEVLALYRRSDLFVFPTHREGFPNVVLEAMAAGLPIVATPVGAIPDAIRDGEEGLLVPPKDASALTEALRHLIDEPKRRLEMGAHARARVASVFTLEVVVRQLEEIYLQLLAR